MESDSVIGEGPRPAVDIRQVDGNDAHRAVSRITVIPCRQPSLYTYLYMEFTREKTAISVNAVTDSQIIEVSYSHALSISLSLSLLVRKDRRARKKKKMLCLSANFSIGSFEVNGCQY